MVDFRWKTEGTRVAGSVTAWPPSVMLLIVISVAVAITALLTGKVSQEESAYKAKKAVYDDLMNRQSAAHPPRSEH